MEEIIGHGGKIEELRESSHATQFGDLFRGYLKPTAVGFRPFAEFLDEFVIGFVVRLRLLRLLAFGLGGSRSLGGDSGAFFLTLAAVSQREIPPATRLGKGLGELLGRSDFHGSHPDDHVARQQPGLGRPRVLLHLNDGESVGAFLAEFQAQGGRGGRGGGRGLRPLIEAGAAAFAGQKIIPLVAEHLDRDVAVFAQTAANVGVDADDPAVGIKQRAARVAGDHRAVGDEKISAIEHAAQAQGRCPQGVETAGMAERDAPGIDWRRLGIGQFRKGVFAWVGDLEHRGIAGKVRAKRFRHGTLAVGKQDNDVASQSREDVGGAEDDTGGIHNYTGAGPHAFGRDQGNGGRCGLIRNGDELLIKFFEIRQVLDQGCGRRAWRFRGGA